MTLWDFQKISMKLWLEHNWVEAKVFKALNKSPQFIQTTRNQTFYNLLFMFYIFLLNDVAQNFQHLSNWKYAKCEGVSTKAKLMKSFFCFYHCSVVNERKRNNKSAMKSSVAIKIKYVQCVVLFPFHQFMASHQWDSTFSNAWECFLVTPKWKRKSTQQSQAKNNLEKGICVINNMLSWCSIPRKSPPSPPT